jgi:hypothetical protein
MFNDLSTSCLVASKLHCLETSDILLEVSELSSGEKVGNYDSGIDLYF